jgi:hypothetical protein
VRNRKPARLAKTASPHAPLISRSP